MIIVDKGKNMFKPHPGILLCTFQILLNWRDSCVTKVRQWRDSGAPTGPTTQKHSRSHPSLHRPPHHRDCPPAFSVAASGLLGTRAPVPVNTPSLR